MRRTNTEDEPRVQIFGEPVSGNRTRSIGDGGGFIVLAAGIMLLLNSFGTVPWTFWDHVVKFWPVLLILAGISIILGNSLLSGLVHMAATVVTILVVTAYGLEKTGSPYLTYFPDWIIGIMSAVTKGVRP